MSYFSEKAERIDVVINQPYKVFENQKRQEPTLLALLI